MNVTPQITPEEWRRRFGLLPVGPPTKSGAAAGPAAKPSKYRNAIQEYQGQRFHSKLELLFEFHLQHLKALGRVSWWTRQVPFYMPGGGLDKDGKPIPAERYLVDFLVVQPERVMQAIYKTPPDPGMAITQLKPSQKFPSRTRLVDCKGFMTPNSASKIKTVSATHGVTIEIVKKGEVDSWI